MNANLRAIRLPASCIAEFIEVSPARKLSVLGPYKYNKRGEGAGRSAYYQATLNAIPKYHNGDNDPVVFQQAIAELVKVEENERLPKRDRTRARLNREAIEAYQGIYGNRKFKILPNRRLTLQIGKVTIKAQPDLWVEENGVQVLLKIGVAKKKSELYIDLILHLIRKAAVAARCRVRARNVVYLNVTTGDEVISELPLTYFNLRIAAACREAAMLWPNVTEPGQRLAPSVAAD